jgi:hypothetical protein
MLALHLGYCFALKVEVTHSSETVLNLDQTTKLSLKRVLSIVTAVTLSDFTLCLFAPTQHHYAKVEKSEG